MKLKTVKEHGLPEKAGQYLTYDGYVWDVNTFKNGRFVSRISNPNRDIIEGESVRVPGSSREDVTEIIIEYMYLKAK
ncbi:MAG: hypothetical protein KY428_12085 [Bacteroidetes bacterium]|nr:hypothetical protein [Bacteroidota bacterium]